MIRDEIVERLYERCQHSKASVGGSVRVLRCSACDAIADALLPIVRKAAWNAAEMSWMRIADHATDEDFDAIVRRVMEGGQ